MLILFKFGMKIVSAQLLTKKGLRENNIYIPSLKTEFLFSVCIFFLTK